MKTTRPQEWICPACNKQIISLYEEQMEQNRESHLRSCEKKKR